MNINKNALRESISFGLGRGPSLKKKNTHTFSVSNTSKLSIKFTFPIMFPLIIKKNKKVSVLKKDKHSIAYATVYIILQMNKLGYAETSMKFVFK